MLTDHFSMNNERLCDHTLFMRSILVDFRQGAPERRRVAHGARRVEGARHFQRKQSTWHDHRKLICNAVSKIQRKVSEGMLVSGQEQIGGICKLKSEIGKASLTCWFPSRSERNRSNVRNRGICVPTIVSVSYRPLTLGRAHTAKLVYTHTPHTHSI